MIALGFASTFGFAQHNAKKTSTGKIPQAVLTAFHKDYGNAKEVSWDEEDGNYEAEFEINKQELSVTYNVQGQKLETEKEISIKELPGSVIQYVQQHKLGKIKEAAKIDKAGKTIYEAEVKGKDYLFDASGKLIQIKD